MFENSSAVGSCQQMNGAAWPAGNKRKRSLWDGRVRVLLSGQKARGCGAAQSTSIAINGLAAPARGFSILSALYFFLPNDAINSAQKDEALNIKANWM